MTSLDGRIAFTDAPQGPLIAKLNKYDPAGADTDWFILNMLRAVSDGVMLGAGTMNAEADYTCHVFDQDMEDMRIEAGKILCRGILSLLWMPRISLLTMCSSTLLRFRL